MKRAYTVMLVYALFYGALCLFFIRLLILYAVHDHKIDHRVEFFVKVICMFMQKEYSSEIICKLNLKDNLIRKAERCWIV